MLGVRHSKACGTCRRRRVKCDEHRPHCSRCERARIVCDGYERTFRFIDEGKNLAQEEASNVSQLVLFEHGPRPPNNHPTEGRLVGHRGTRQPQDLIPQSISLPSTDDEYVSFLVKRLFSGGPKENHHRELWIENSFSASSTNAAYVALKSVSTIFYGRMHGNQEQVMLRGAILYGRALKLLRNAIKNPRTCFDHTTLSATMALFVYELMAYTNHDGYIHHAGGIGRLIENRGPQRHQDDPDHEYFVSSRAMVISEALISRKRTFLEREEWKLIPWVKKPGSKTAQQHVEDILCDVPGFYEDFRVIHQVAAEGINTETQRQSLIDKIIDDLRSLVCWRWNWERRNSAVVVEVPAGLSETLPVYASDQSLFTTVFNFANLTIANELDRYNNTLLLLMHIGGLVYGPGIMSLVLSVYPEDERPKKKNPLILPHEGISTLDVTTEICRSIDYHFLTHQINNQSVSLLPSLRLCFIILASQNQIQKLQWVIRIIGMISDATGVQARHLIRLNMLGSSSSPMPSRETVGDEVEQLVDHIEPPLEHP